MFLLGYLLGRMTNNNLSSTIYELEKKQLEIKIKAIKNIARNDYYFTKLQGGSNIEARLAEDRKMAELLKNL